MRKQPFYYKTKNLYPSTEKPKQAPFASSGHTRGQFASRRLPLGEFRSRSRGLASLGPQQSKAEFQQSQPFYKAQSQVADNTTMRIQYKTLPKANPGNPEVWGPAFWLTLHNGALHYPKNASPFWTSRMKAFIEGIPILLPCERCSDHACAYIESQRHNLDQVVKNKKNLFEFFVKFHNFVNEKEGKPQITLAQAKKMYGGKSDVLTVEYGPV